MIQTGITDLLVIYVIALVAGISLIALVGKLFSSRRRKTRRRGIVGCPICGEYYEDPDRAGDGGMTAADAPVECPNCGSLNERRPLRHI